MEYSAEMNRAKGRKQKVKEKKEQRQREGSDKRRESCKLQSAIMCQIKELWDEMGRDRTHLSRLRRKRQKQRAEFESKLAKFESSRQDVLLSSVSKDFNLLIADLTDQLSHQHCKCLLVYPSFEPLLKELVQLHWRSRNILSEFSGFSCIRLVLDKQSPLASQFMDFFCDLQWLLVSLLAHIEAHINGRSEVPLPVNHIHTGFDKCRFHKVSMDIRLGWIERCHSLLDCLKPVVYTCITLYTLYKLSKDDLTQSLFQRATKHQPRMFTQDLYHYYSRSFGDLKDWDLDSFKDTRVELDKGTLGRGAFGSVCKGYFVRTPSGQIVGEPVAVKVIFEQQQDSESDSSSPFFSSSSGNDGASSCKEQSSGLSKFVTYLCDISGCSSDSDSLLLETPHISELRKLATLQHPNIVEVKGYIDRRELDNGLIAESGIVMELMDASLDKFIHKMQDDKEGIFTELEVVDLMLEIARAMRFLHENAVTHRDLKPANVLLKCHTDSTICLEVKVGDFGLTKRIPESKSFPHAGTAEHTGPAGTTGYMAPEIRIKSENGTYTDKVDVYSYGITCLDTITGIPDQKLISGKYKELYDAIACGEWRKWIKTMMPICPLDVINIIAACLHSDPSCRPTFAEICFKLQQIKWRLLWPYTEESQLRSKHVEKGSGLVLAKVLCNGLSGLKMMVSLLNRVPECAHISLQEYLSLPMEVQERQRNHVKVKSSAIMEKEMIQHLHWRIEVLAEAMNNVIVIDHNSQTSHLRSKSDVLLHFLKAVCTDLVDDIFAKFFYLRDSPGRSCECETHHLVGQKNPANLTRVDNLIDEFPQHILEFDGIKSICLFSDLVDACFGVNRPSLPPEEIESLRNVASHQYLLRYGLLYPLMNTDSYFGDIIHDFKSNFVRYEVVSTLLRWSRLWKKSLNVPIPLPCDEDVIDYTLICRDAPSAEFTLSANFDHSLGVFLKACNITENASSPFDEDDSMLPLLKSFYMLCG